MTDRPIIFSAPMVRALLDGRKTQTRQALSPQPVMVTGRGKRIYADGVWRKSWRDGCDDDLRLAVGDRLWVRETAAVRYQGWHHKDGDTHQVTYRADEDEHGRWLGLPSCGAGIRKGKAPSAFPANSLSADGRCRWQPSTCMPRWASRLTLTVTGVRIERLQAITEADAIAEGASQYGSQTELHRDWNPDWKGHYRWGFMESWDGLNAKRGFGWDENPWVAAVAFEVHSQNIDQMPAAQAAA